MSKKYKAGDEVTVTFKGKVAYDYDGSGYLSVSRNNSSKTSYFEPGEVPHLAIIVHKPAFNPKSGEVYMLRAAGGKGEWTNWFVMQRSYTGQPNMVSPAGVYTLEEFRQAYDNDSCELVRADIKPE